jgi:hypothetical protein
MSIGSGGDEKHRDQFLKLGVPIVLNFAGLRGARCLRTPGRKFFPE